MMYTNNKGVSYYKKGKKYFSNTGWLEHEISKEEYDFQVTLIMSKHPSGCPSGMDSRR